MKLIKCPHCQSPCEIGTGYYHDDKINIRCGKCHQVILATNEEDEKQLVKLYTKPVKETIETTNAWNHHLRHQIQPHQQQQSNSHVPTEFDGAGDYY
jgi:hypothetical protein